ncbi:MAG: glycyl-radical enzyme activating protein [Firmicutes bacterium]|nr:glycyl-radical enzyme activating protein [Bacillota bacterium]
MTTVNIFDIQRFSYHDGPGIRTVVFLKGCNMRCLWCQNPESQSPDPEVLYHEHLCTGCGKCLQVCPYGCHRIDNGQRVFIREKCTACGKCVELCYAGALELAGAEVEIEDILRIVRRDIPFYQISQGGVTLSGGEPFFQAEASLKLLQACKEEGIHTAVETAGNVEWAVIELV